MIHDNWQTTDHPGRKSWTALKFAPLMRQFEFVPVEFERGVAMSEKIGNAMPARVKMEFMRNLKRIKGLVQFARTTVKAKESSVPQSK